MAETTWETKDINIATFLQAAGQEFVGAKDAPGEFKGNKKMKVFIFKDQLVDGKSACERMKEDFLFERPDTKIVAKRVLEVYRSLRALSYR